MSADFTFELDEDALEDIAKDILKEHLASEGVEYSCPECDTTLQLKTGDNVCPKCGFEIQVSVDKL